MASLYEMARGPESNIFGAIEDGQNAAFNQKLGKFKLADLQRADMAHAVRRDRPACRGWTAPTGRQSQKRRRRQDHAAARATRVKAVWSDGMTLRGCDRLPGMRSGPATMAARAERAGVSAGCWKSPGKAWSGPTAGKRW